MRHSLTSLKIFVAVAETGNLTHAAAREHLAVSAVSKRIAELEELVRTPLLKRKARGVTLTPAGLSLLRRARQVLQAVQNMEAELGEYAGGVKGHVRIHAVASALTQLLQEEIESFLTRYPLVQLSLEERTSKAIVAAIDDGTADIGVVADPGANAALALFPYQRDRLAIGIPAGHPLSRRRSVRFVDIAKFPFVGPHADSSLSALMARAARTAGQAIQQRVQASSFDAMCRLVEARLGITMLPEGVLTPNSTAAVNAKRPPRTTAPRRGNRLVSGVLVTRQAINQVGEKPEPNDGFPENCTAWLTVCTWPTPAESSTIPFRKERPSPAVAPRKNRTFNPINSMLSATESPHRLAPATTAES